MSDRAWNRNDKGLSRWEKDRSGGEGRNDSDDGVHREDPRGIKRIKVEPLLKSQEDEDDGMLEVCMLEAAAAVFEKLITAILSAALTHCQERFFVLLTDPTITIREKRSTNPEACRSHFQLHFRSNLGLM